MNSMLSKTRLISLSAIAAAVTAAMPVSANDASEVANATDREWITLTGKVASVATNSFTLDYGQNDIMVEMDDYDWFNENAVKKGESVTVTGRMDNDFFESRKIEASTVYVDSRNEHFFASAADEEEAVLVSLVHDHLRDDEWVSLTGKVTRVNGQDITLDTGIHEYDIDANGLSYNPFDSEGAERIEVGERVAVYGVMDDADLFDDREIEASSIVTLSSSAS